MLRPIKKVLKETPLVGRVINSLVSDNPEENAPSIKAVSDLKNEFVDGTTSVGNSNKLGNIAASKYLTKEKTNLLKYPTTAQSDVLLINLDGSKNGFIDKINGNASEFTNLPFPNYKGVIVAEKTQKVLSNVHAYVELKMIFPFPHTTFRAVYNTKWEGWKLVEGEVIMWNGSAQQGSVIDTGYLTADLFGQVDLICSDGIALTRKRHGDVYAGNILKGGDDADYTLFAGQFDYTGNKLTVNKAKKRSLSTNTTSNFVITRVVGRP